MGFNKSAGKAGHRLGGLVVACLLFSGTAAAQSDYYYGSGKVEAETQATTATSRSAAGPTNSIGTSLYDWAMDWNVAAFSVATLVENDVMERGGSRFSTNTQITAKRRIKGTNWRFGLGQPFIYASAGYDRYNDNFDDGYQESEFTLIDPFIEFSNGKLALLPGNIDLYGSFKIYAPTSENSQEIGQIARLKAFFIFTKPVTSWLEAKYFFEPSYYVQSRNAVRSTFVGDSGSEVEYARLTRAYDIEQWVEVWFKITNSEGVGFQLGSEDRYKNQSKAEGKYEAPERKISFGPAAMFELSSVFRFKIAYENEVNSDTNAADFGRFKPEHTQVTLLTWIDI